MGKKTIVSRIHKFLNEELIMQLDKICNNLVISDNNKKVRMIKDKLDEHGVMYNELGPGTNRYAIAIDGYVFKIAMDKWGKQDNANEFTMSKELQPYVVKVYENNDLISVCEYVTLIGREEFLDSREEITEILSIIGESYLMGDVGYVEKNFTNWGYRDDGQMTILDFAYIHNIEGREMLCSEDGVMLDYSENFHYLRCPQCSKKYSFSEIRRKIPVELEWKYINSVKNESYHLTEPHIYISEDGQQKNKPIRKEEEDHMRDERERENIFDLEEEEILDGYNDLFDTFISRKKKAEYTPPEDIQVEVEEEVIVVEVEEEEEIPDDPITAVDILRQQAEDLVQAAEVIEEAAEAIEVSEVIHHQREAVLKEELEAYENKSEKDGEMILTLEDALSTTDFNAESTAISRDEEADSIKVNIVTPSSDTEVHIEASGQVDVKIEQPNTIDKSIEESEGEGFLLRMQKAYIEGQNKPTEEPEKPKSGFILRTPGAQNNTVADGAVSEEEKYRQMAKDAGYEVD